MTSEIVICSYQHLESERWNAKSVHKGWSGAYSLRRVHLDRLDGATGVSSHSGCYKSVLTANLKPVSTSVAGRTSHRHWVPRYLFTMICGGSEAACYQWVMVWFIDAIQPPCATAHWHGGGWVVGRPPAVGLPSCLHAATGMEEVGWWGDPREGFILTKP